MVLVHSLKKKILFKEEITILHRQRFFFSISFLKINSKFEIKDVLDRFKKKQQHGQADYFIAISSFMYKQIKSKGAVFSCVNQSRTTEAYQELWAYLK